MDVVVHQIDGSRRPRAATGRGTAGGLGAAGPGDRPLRPGCPSTRRGSIPTWWRRVIPARRARVLGVRVERASLARGRPARGRAGGLAPSCSSGAVGAPAVRPCGPLPARAPVRRTRWRSARASCSSARCSRALLEAGRSTASPGLAFRASARPEGAVLTVPRARLAELRGDGLALPRRHVRCARDSGRIRRRPPSSRPTGDARSPARSATGARPCRARSASCRSIACSGELDWIARRGSRTSTSSTRTTACGGATWTSCATSDGCVPPPASRATCSSTSRRTRPSATSTPCWRCARRASGRTWRCRPRTSSRACSRRSAERTSGSTGPSRCAGSVTSAALPPSTS